MLTDENPFLIHLPAFDNQTGALAFMRGLVGRLGLDNLTYLGVDIPTLNAHRDYVITTYSDAWSVHYYEQGYQRFDPVIGMAMSSILPVDWQDRPKDKPVERFFGEAHEFGLASQGLSIPIRGAFGDRALFSINTDLPDKEWQRFKKEHIGNLVMLAFHYHQAVMNMEHQRFPIARSQLSSREREVLFWAAEGKSSAETATILGLSSATVNFYLRNLFAKLGCVNKTQAVASAIRFDLLS